MKILRLIAVTAIHAILVLPAHAQPASSRGDSNSEAAKSDDEARNALYHKFLETYKTDEPAAYGFANECLRKYPPHSEEAKYLKRWVEVYDFNLKRRRKAHVVELIEKASLEQAFALGREILVSEPQDLHTLTNLINGGLIAFGYGKSSLVAEASGYARKALELVESGKAITENKEYTLGWLNRSLGILLLISAPAEAAEFLYKALNFESLKNDAVLYSFLADAILASKYAPLLKQYNSRYPTQKEQQSAEARALRATMNKAADLAINALARAVALTPANDPLRAQWMQFLTRAYRVRNSGYLTGLTEFVDTILRKPLPR